MIKLPDFYILQTPFGCHDSANVEDMAYDLFAEAAEAETETRVFHTTLDVETNAHESTREVTDDFIDRMIEAATDLNDLPDWIQHERAQDIAMMHDSEQAEADHAASFSQPSTIRREL